MERVRVDKWLWAARFFKTRALAVRACELGRVECNEQKVKPSREVKVGDRLKVRIEQHEFTVDVLGVSEMRGPAAVAQGLYAETAESRERREKAAAERKALTALDPWAAPGRPTKRDRRVINRLRGR
jgi:ribosome-associated heat shock protein Hsp15